MANVTSNDIRATPLSHPCVGLLPDPDFGIPVVAVESPPKPLEFGVGAALGLPPPLSVITLVTLGLGVGFAVKPVDRSGEDSVVIGVVGPGDPVFAGPDAPDIMPVYVWL